MNLDPEFLKFYAGVQDPSWPAVTNYADFFVLPSAIRAECETIHGLGQHLDEICDPAYWRHMDLDLCVRGRLAFVPVAKCASNYYLRHFTQAGWVRKKLHEIDLDDSVLFGVIMHPLKRYLKGITQHIVYSFSPEMVEAPDSFWGPYKGMTDWETIDRVMALPGFKNFVKGVAVGDLHSWPYHLWFGDLLSRTHWIPLDFLPPSKTEDNINALLEAHGHPALQFDSKPSHESLPEQALLFQQLTDWFQEDHDQMHYFYKIYGPDLKFYYQLLRKHSQ